ncbi:hypothetical protein POM88_016376 [Heracleum sosnowskyi]|uniref:Uncharacterized protein n=1 Tax=Heracleum sosnowskyi TaxID=360622 RepID=A0AAD8INU9_9APIA|nr:hypothetical protein POM88_016376 [Heracleum sosnowskyi]
MSTALLALFPVSVDMITPETIDFFVSDAHGDPDCPSQGFSSIEQALSMLRQGKLVIVVHDENEDAEGSLVMATSLETPQNVAFMVKHGSGIVSVGMKGKDLERLNIPLMSPENEDDVSAPSIVSVNQAAEAELETEKAYKQIEKLKRKHERDISASK